MMVVVKTAENTPINRKKRWNSVYGNGSVTGHAVFWSQEIIRYSFRPYKEV